MVPRQKHYQDERNVSRPAVKLKSITNTRRVAIHVGGKLFELI